MRYAHFWASNPGLKLPGYKFPLILLFLTLLGLSPLFAQANEGARLFFDKAWKTYLMETVRRGLPRIPVIALDPPSQTPWWPGLDQRLADARDLGESADWDLLDSWTAMAQRRGRDALVTAEKAWLTGQTSQLNPLELGVTYLRCLRLMNMTNQASSAWKQWEQKYRSPDALAEGLELLELQGDPQTVGLLRQAVQLYPGDRRFFTLMLLHRSEFPQIDRLVQRDFRTQGGFSAQEIRKLIRLLSSNPENRRGVVTLLWETGHRSRDLQLAASLEGLTDGRNLIPQTLADEDYRLWCRFWSSHGEAASQAEGTFSWDPVPGALSSAWVSLHQGQLDFWSEGYGNSGLGAFCASFENNRFKRTMDRVGDSRWSVIWEEYPYLQAVEWARGDERIVYSFEPFVLSQPLLEPGKLSGAQALWPLNGRLPFAIPGLALDRLLPLAVRKDSYKGTLLIQRLCLAQGEVWMAVEDTNEDGRPDTWSFFKEGKIDRVYRNWEWDGAANVVELYHEGQLRAVLADPERRNKTEFALYPQSQTELWDWTGSGLPVMRVIHEEKEQIRILVFSKKTPPFLSMPAWPVFTWP